VIPAVPAGRDVLPLAGYGARRDFVYAFTKSYYLGVTTRCLFLRAMEGLTPERSR
jgi:hypothetical protein